MLIKAARMCQELARDLENHETIKGYIIYQNKPEVEKKQLPIEIKQEEQQTVVEEEDNKLVEKFKNKLIKDFCPIMLTQFVNEPCLEYESFD